MGPDDFFIPLKGQSLLYPGIDERFRGQCVQSVMKWIKHNGTEPPVYFYAYQYYDNGIPGYTRFPRGTAIKRGDIVVWGSNYPKSPGAGHIDVAADDGDINDFWAWDSNWTPLQLNRIHHNGSDNNYIKGYLRRENMVTNAKAIKQAYLACLGVEATQQQITNRIDEGQSTDYVLDDLMNSQERADYAYRITDALNYQKTHPDTSQATVLKPGVYVIK